MRLLAARRLLQAKGLLPAIPERAGRHLKRALGISGGCAFAALLSVAGQPVLHWLYAIDWIAAEHYHIALAALCVVPAAAAHAAALHAGARGAAWWLVWLPGLAVYSAFPWPVGGAWQPLWIFGYVWDAATAIFLRWETASSFAFNSLGAFVGMLTVALVAIGRLWLGLSKALRRAGSEALAPDPAEEALPHATWAARKEILDKYSVADGIVLGELTDPTRESPDFAPGRPKTWGNQGQGQLITMSPTDGNGHVLVTSQASGYKSTGLVIPNILTYKIGPILVFDPKCELYARTHEARRAMGFEPVVIDAENGFDPARLIAALAVKHPAAYYEMAKLMIPKGYSGIENAAYFKAAATKLFTALLGYYGEKGSTNMLQNIAEVLALPPDKVFSQVQKRIEDTKLPFVKNQLNALQGMDSKFWHSIKTEITNQLLFGEMPDVQRYITMKRDSKLPSQVIDPNCDIFLNIPQHVAENFPAMLRLMLGSMLTTAQLIEINEAPRARRLFLIDEAAKLGAMDILENIRDRGRSLGLHLMLFYQTPGEIARLWGQAGMTSWRDGCSATIMGPVSSRTSAQDLSAMLGTQIVRVKTESTSSSNQVMRPMAGSVSSSEQEQLRDVPLMTATAISQLPTHASIITATGRKPILASKAIFFAREDMQERVRSTEEITDELEVTKTQRELTDRLAKLTESSGKKGGAQPAAPGETEVTPHGEADGNPEPARVKPVLSEIAKARGPRGSRQGDVFLSPEVAAAVIAGNVDPAAIEIEGDFEPPFAVPGAGNDDGEGDVLPVTSGRGGPAGTREPAQEQRSVSSGNVPGASDADEPHASTAAVEESNSGETQDGQRPGNAPEGPAAETRDETDAARSERETGTVSPEAGNDGIRAADVETGAAERKEAGGAHAAEGSEVAASSDERSADSDPDPEHEDGSTTGPAPPVASESEESGSSRVPDAEEPVPVQESAEQLDAGRHDQEGDGSGPETQPAEGDGAGSPGSEHLAAAVAPGIDRDGAGVEAGGGPASDHDAASAGPDTGPGPVGDHAEDAMTTEEAERFMELGQDGLSLAEIAAEMGRSEAALAAWNKGQRSRGLLPDLGNDDSEEPGDDGPEPGA